MNNRYSLTIFGVMLLLIGTGVMMALSNNWYGLIPFIMGAMMTRDFEILKDSPRTEGLISVLGKKKNIKVEGLILTFQPFGLPIVSVVKFDMRKVEHKIPLKNIVCSDGGVVEGEISMSLAPGESARELNKLDDSAGMDGVRQLINDIAEIGLQKIATESPETTANYIVTHRIEIGRKLKIILEGGGAADADSSDDKRVLGVNIVQLQVNLSKDKTIITAEQNVLIAGVMSRRMQERLEFYKKDLTPGKVIPSLQEIRKELVYEDLVAANKVTVVSGGGVNLNNVNP